MFYRAALDISDDQIKSNSRFYSCIRFVSDTCTPAVFYFNNEWLKQEALVRAGINTDGLLPAQIELLKERDLYPKNPKALEQPNLVYLKEGSWETAADPETGKRSGLVIPKREFIRKRWPAGT